jgi:AhpD family alkylhydroperoxidase
MTLHHHSYEYLMFVKRPMQATPKEAQAFRDKKEITERSDGTMANKTRERISLAVALTTQCVYCIETHTKNTAYAGALPEEITETVFIASAPRAGAAVGHGLRAFRLLREAQNAIDSKLVHDDQGAGSMIIADCNTGGIAFISYLESSFPKRGESCQIQFSGK